MVLQALQVASLPKQSSISVFHGATPRGMPLQFYSGGFLK